MHHNVEILHTKCQNVSNLITLISSEFHSRKIATGRGRLHRQGCFSCIFRFTVWIQQWMRCVGSLIFKYLSTFILWCWMQQCGRSVKKIIFTGAVSNGKRSWQCFLQKVGWSPALWSLWVKSGHPHICCLWFVLTCMCTLLIFATLKFALL